MNNKQWLSIFLVFTLIIAFLYPTLEVNAESEWQKIDRQLQQIQQQKKEAARKAKNISQQIEELNEEQKDIETEISSIESQINETEERLFSLEEEIEEVTNQAKTAAEELEQAIERVEERDQLLKTRVRLMYRRGTVQYLEVLLGANSFSDFLQRFDVLQKIIDSDKNILEGRIEDRNTIAAKKEEIDQALAQLEALYTEAELLRASYVEKKKDRLVKIASLEQAEQELNEVKDEEEKFIKDLAAKESKLIEKKHNLMFKGFFAWPVPDSTRITSDFGIRTHPVTGKKRMHKGIDIGRAPGTSSLYGADIVAAADGIVIVATYVSGYGNTVMLDHGGGLWTLYGHIRNGGIFVKTGQRVSKGQKIAEVGSTGRSTGPHLHFEVMKNKKSVSPWDYFKK